MRYAIFQTELAKLSKWFHKTLTDEYAQILYERISHIPDEPFGDIVRDIMDSERYWPTPRRFLDGWRDWQDGNRSSMIPESEWTDCPACGGCGILCVWRYGKDVGTWYSYGMRCGECRAGEKALPSGTPRLTRVQAVSKGWRLRGETLNAECGTRSAER